MTEFLPEGSLYVFIGVASVLFTMMLGCFLYHKGKTYCPKPIFLLRNKSGKSQSFRRGTRRNKFLMKKGERADGDEENATAETIADKMRATIDQKYNNKVVWTTLASSGEAQVQDIDAQPQN